MRSIMEHIRGWFTVNNNSYKTASFSWAVLWWVNTWNMFLPCSQGQFRHIPPGVFIIILVSHRSSWREERTTQQLPGRSAIIYKCHYQHVTEGKSENRIQDYMLPPTLWEEHWRQEIVVYGCHMLGAHRSLPDGCGWYLLRLLPLHGVGDQNDRRRAAL